MTKIKTGYANKTKRDEQLRKLKQLVPVLQSEGEKSKLLLTKVNLAIERLK